jgi:tRNA dimethylallyltransferase
MLAGGWVDEVRRLADVVPAEAPAWNATGYGAVRDVVTGRATLAAARERIVAETRQYAKRQRTWLRHQLGEARIKYLNPDDPAAASLVERWWRGEHLE